MPTNPIVNDTFTMGFIGVPLGLEPQVRVRGVSRPPPVAESREANEWQRSIKSRKSVSPKILSGTATGKLVGAVTHVLVNDPQTGYGIFIENMLEAAG